MWGVRPDAEVYRSVVRYLRARPHGDTCGNGIQTAAKAFFGRGRIDASRFVPARDGLREWKREEMRLQGRTPPKAWNYY